MATNVEWPLFRVQTSDDLETRLVDSTFRLLCILESNADLITQFWMLIGLEDLHWLREVVLDKVDESAVVLFLHARVAYDEGTVCDDRSGRLIEQGLTLILEGCAATWTS